MILQSRPKWWPDQMVCQTYQIVCIQRTVRVHHRKKKNSDVQPSITELYSNLLYPGYEVRGCIKPHFMVSLNKAEMQQWKCQRKKQQAELAYSCRQMVRINTNQYKVARNCPRHKRQLQSQIWHLLLLAIILFGSNWGYTHHRKNRKFEALEALLI